jgi:cytochrome c peroxidase
MSFNVFRATFRTVGSKPLRRTAVQVNTRTVFRSNFNRTYSTPPPSKGDKSSSKGIYIGLGAVAAIGAAYYFYATTSGREAATAVKSGLQAAKVKANFVPTKDDYIKVTIFLLSHGLNITTCNRSTIVLLKF